MQTYKYWICNTELTFKLSALCIERWLHYTQHCFWVSSHLHTSPDCKPDKKKKSELDERGTRLQSKMANKYKEDEELSVPARELETPLGRVSTFKPTWWHRARKKQRGRGKKNKKGNSRIKT